MSAAPINPQVLDGERDAKKTDRKSMVEMILRVMNGAGGEAPRFAVMAIRDWWYLRRGPKWRFPLPEPKRFKSLPNRDGLRRLMRGRAQTELPTSSRRAFVPSVFVGAYTRYQTLDPWINGTHRGRVKRRVRP